MAISREHLVGQLHRTGKNPEDIRLVVQQRPVFDSVVTVTGTTYEAVNEIYILVDDDTAGAAVTVNLLPAADYKGREKHVVKLGTTANVTVDGNDTETINGATTQTLTTQYATLHIVSDGTAWYIL